MYSYLEDLNWHFNKIDYSIAEDGNSIIVSISVNCPGLKKKRFKNHDYDYICRLLSKKQSKRLVFVGDDPLDSPELVYYICCQVHEDFPNREIWIYSFLPYSSIKQDSAKRALHLAHEILDNFCHVYVEADTKIEHRLKEVRDYSSKEDVYVLEES